MPHVFISYSRKDADFVRRLQERLRARDHEVWVDLEGIPPTAEWLSEIQKAIEAADAVAFVLSPEFASSEVCGLELAHAVETNKRLIPLLRSDTPAKAVPKPLRDLNWILFRESDDFDAVDRLVKAIDTDLEQVRAHTRYLTRALEWERRGSDKSLRYAVATWARRRPGWRRQTRESLGPPSCTAGSSPPAEAPRESGAGSRRARWASASWPPPSFP